MQIPYRLAVVSVTQGDASSAGREGMPNRTRDHTGDLAADSFVPSAGCPSHALPGGGDRWLIIAGLVRRASEQGLAQAILRTPPR